jgi:excisionase family DNA binding protein
MDPAPTLLTADELCGWLRIPKSTLYKLCKEGKIPVVKVGKHWRFDPKAIEHWLARAPQQHV